MIRPLLYHKHLAMAYHVYRATLSPVERFGAVYWGLQLTDFVQLCSYQIPCHYLIRLTRLFGYYPTDGSYCTLLRRRDTSGPLGRLAVSKSSKNPICSLLMYPSSVKPKSRQSLIPGTVPDLAHILRISIPCLPKLIHTFCNPSKSSIPYVFLVSCVSSAFTAILETYA